MWQRLQTLSVSLLTNCLGSDPRKPAEHDLEEGGETDESRKKQRRPT